MYNVLLYFLLQGDSLCCPTPSKEITALVQQLGNDSFEKREQAHNKLTQLGWEALKAINQGIYSEDKEISCRCRRIQRAYFDCCPLTNDFPSYLKLPVAIKRINLNKRELTFFTANDATKIYHDLFWLMRPTATAIYFDNDVARLTAYYLTKKELARGLSRAEAQKIIQKAKKNTERQWQH